MPRPLSFSPISQLLGLPHLCNIKFQNKKMEVVHIYEDKTVAYVQADSFPEDALKSHQILHGKLPYSAERGYYGISWLEHGKIKYLAAAGLLEEGEAARHGLETFTIQAGDYLSEKVTDFKQNIPAIGQTFQRLLADPRLDPKGYCLEIYDQNDKDVHCLVKLV